MSNQRPAAGFNWHAVSWGGPDQIRSDICSYCDASIDEHDVPLILASADGWVAQFCDACQARWWGMEKLAP